MPDSGSATSSRASAGPSPSPVGSTRRGNPVASSTQARPGVRAGVSAGAWRSLRSPTTTDWMPSANARSIWPCAHATRAWASSHEASST
ncbi:MAG: hypothetical protein EBQ99_10200 [Planctomycetes bacterium]|nr:hypothetical protein [Planctomycetota bacterium]